MTEMTYQPRVSRIYNYVIGSSDLYYAEVAQRDVFVREDPKKGFQIWGQLAGAGPQTSIGLCQMFLEFGMYCHSWGNLDKAIFNMRTFGEKLGIALANFIRKSPPADMKQNPGVCSLMCLWESMNIQFSVEQVGPEMHFMFANCPLEETAERTGMHYEELALYGINALCQALIYAIDPNLKILTPLETRPDFIFAVKEAVS